MATSSASAAPTSRRSLRWPVLAIYLLAWLVCSAPLTWAFAHLSARECAWRPGYDLAGTAVALAVLLVGTWTLAVTSRAWLALLAWLALAVPPSFGLLLGFGCNVLWW